MKYLSGTIGYALGFYNEAFSKYLLLSVSKSGILQTKTTSVCLQSISNQEK